MKFGHSTLESKKGERFAGTKVPTFEEALDCLPRNVWINGQRTLQGEVIMPAVIYRRLIA